MAEFGTPRRLRTDNGAEYTANKFKDYCRDSKIKQEFTVPETPEQNGVAERFNRKLPKRCWVRALSTAAHIRNLTVTTGSSQGKSHFKLFIGKPPRRNHLFFLAAPHVMKRKVNLKKLGSRSVKAKFIGYDDRSTAYTSCKNVTQKRSSKHAMLSSRKAKYSPPSAKETINTENPNLVSPNMDFEDDRSNDENTNIPVQDRVGENNTATLVVLNQPEIEGKPEEKKSHYPEKAETVAHRKDMDYPTLST